MLDPLSSKLANRFRVKERAGTNTGLGNLPVKDGQPPTVVSFGLRALPPGVTVETVTLDKTLRKQVIEGVNANLAEFYREVPLAAQRKEALWAHEKAGAYDSISDGDAFAGQLTNDLPQVSHDKHLRVDFNPFKMPSMGKPSPEDEVRSITRGNTITVPSRKSKFSQTTSVTFASMALSMHRCAGRL